ncbi:MAG: bifunctional helix-turn-helix transcriptional regulator/GNAT family N-acetyltransferase [Planctomycetota bacterium]
MDMLSELRELAFATRLKRLSERLWRDVSRIYDELEVEFEPRWFPILYSLSQNTSMTITALADTLRLTHPAVNQIAAEMSDKGLLISFKCKEDERRRLLRLSSKGKKTVERLKPAWELIRLATGALITESGYDMLSAMDRIEQLLTEQSLYERVRLQQNGPLEIVDFKPAWKRHFRGLTLEWLAHHFSVEADDEAVLSDPQSAILDPGGAVLFARLNNKFVGTCALIRHDSGLFELAKMGVTESARGMGIGRRLALAVIERAGALGAEVLYLQTSPKLKAANHLYKNLGFRKVSKNPLSQSHYQRCTTVMRRRL